MKKEEARGNGSSILNTLRRHIKVFSNGELKTRVRDESRGVVYKAMVKELVI